MRRVLRWIVRAVVVIVVLAAAVIVAFRLAAAWRETDDAATAAPPTGRYIATRSGRVFIQEAGPADGVAVVLFHGTAAWSELWRGTMTALAAAGFHAVAIDIPPFGYSDRPGTYTRLDQAERVGDIIDTLKLPPVIIVGHSFGAGAAVETVLRFPDRIRGVVLIDAALGLTAPADDGPPALLRNSQLREALVALTITNPLMTRRLLASLIEKKERAADYVTLLQRPMALKGSTPALSDWLLYFLSGDRAAMSADRSAYGRISAPVAIIWGDRDTVTPFAQAEDLRTLMPRATMTVLPGLGHIPQIEDPAAFTQALTAQVARMR
jgi:pimeloyl-ACP methyl ester carboxylesterase